MPEPGGDVRRVAPRDRARRGTRRLRSPAVDAHQRPRQDRARSCAVHPPARRHRCLGGRRHHRVVAPRRSRRLRRDAERVQHQWRTRRHRRRRHHPPACGRCGTGTRRQGAGVDGVSRGRCSRSLPGGGPRLERCDLHGRRHRATPARTASRSRSLPSRHPSLWRALADAGIPPAGLGARDTLRLESALPLHGHELGPGITSLQAGLGWVVAWNKPAFVGSRRGDRRTRPRNPTTAGRGSRPRADDPLVPGARSSSTAPLSAT